MDNKIYELKTIKEILEVVNENNVDNFIIDFSNFLKVRNEVKSIAKHFPEEIEKIEADNTFKWIDDGKNDMHLTFKIL